MLFNSLDYFAFFITVVFVARLLTKRVTFRVIFLLFASYVFYVSNNGLLIILILFSTFVDYYVGLAIEGAKSNREKKIALCLSVIANLSILAYFKYIDFFRESISHIAYHWGVELGWTDLNIILPVGISFYTFQSMSYSIDVYRGVIQAEKSWFRFAFYVAYFPQLIAGPIMRATYFLPQLEKTKKITLRDVEWGLFLIGRGLIKKVVLADFLAIYADNAFSLNPEQGSLELLIGLYAFTFQIYFDFSGYTDIAIGSSRLLGYKIPDNFNKPYAAVSFSDFWKRWHISLSSWLRDYLYIPLGGNRVSKFKTYRNLMITMLLGGLWHGAGWQFIVWGFMHGAYLVTERLLTKKEPKVTIMSPGRLLIKRLFIFHCIVLTWLPFRSDDLSSAVSYFIKMVSFTPSKQITIGMVVVSFVMFSVLLVQWIPNTNNLRANILKIPYYTKAVAYSVSACLIVIFNSKGAQPFIYFQF